MAVSAANLSIGNRRKDDAGNVVWIEGLFIRTGITSYLAMYMFSLSQQILQEALLVPIRCCIGDRDDICPIHSIVTSKLCPLYQ